MECDSSPSLPRYRIDDVRLLVPKKFMNKLVEKEVMKVLQGTPLMKIHVAKLEEMETELKKQRALIDRLWKEINYIKKGAPLDEQTE
jgi:hypothetical protein